MLDEPGSATLLEVDEVVLSGAGGQSARAVTSARPAHGAVLVLFSGVADRSEAERLRGLEVLVPRERLAALGEGEYYAADLVGMAARRPDGTAVGRVVEVMDAGAAPVLLLRKDSGEEVQIPLADVFVKRIDLAAGEMVVEPPEEAREG